MSNAMRFGKRSLAGVAAGALALGMLTIASAPAASAAPSVKPKASLTGTVSPVRVTLTGTALDTVPFAQLSWSSTVALGGSDTVDIQLTTAPSQTAVLGIGIPARIGTSVGTFDPTATPQFSRAAAGETLTAALTTTTIGAVDQGATARIALAASQPGTYAGTLTSNSTTGACVTGANGATGGGVCDVVAFSFTTTGAGASMTLTPASQSITQSAVTTLTATLRDSAGNITQPVLVDAVSVGTNGGTVSPTAISMVSTSGTSSASADSLWDGTATITYTAPASTGTYTVTATPAGTLPGGGVTTQNATVSVAGTAPATTAISAISVTSPANAANSGTLVTARAAQVPAGTNSVTVTFAVSPAPAAGTTYRFGAVAVSPATGTINGATAAVAAVTGSNPPTSGQVDTALAAAPAAAFVNASTNASGVGTATFTLGGGLLGVGSQLVITQVQPNNTRVTSGGVMTVTQASAIVSDTLSTTTPAGNIVQALGTPTPVTVTVLDQFQAPIPNATVRAYRGSATGTLLSSGVTNATGQASVTVSNVASLAVGGSETYFFTVTPFGSSTSTTLAPTTQLTILYTASGAVTSMVVTVAGGATSPILNTTTSIATIPYLYVPYTGIVTGASTEFINTSTGAVNIGGTSGNYATFSAAPNPANMVTVTVPEGVKVSTTVPSATTLWSAGSQSVTAASSQPVYVWGTKTGTHEITFTSGAITTKAKIEVDTPPAAAYNIAVSPSSRTIEAGAFSSVELTVSDVFGNPIPGVTNVAGAAGAVAATATGEVLLGGLTANAVLGTGATGKSTVTLIAGKPGVGKVTFAPSGGAANAAAAWQTGYVKPVGAPDPVKSAEVSVIISNQPSQSITITGSRTTVSGKPGIKVDGAVTGIENGKTVVPYFRFPGETAFSQGTARPVISGGKFTWERKTGKKFYAYVTSDDGAIKSNRVIIAAN